MAKVGPNAVNLAIAEMIGQLLTFTTHPNVQCIMYNQSLNVSIQPILPAALSGITASEKVFTGKFKLTASYNGTSFIQNMCYVS